MHREDAKSAKGEDRLRENPCPMVSQESGYSDLRAVIGSTFAARRAGSQHASKTMPANSAQTTAKVIGSAGFTW